MSIPIKPTEKELTEEEIREMEYKRKRSEFEFMDKNHLKPRGLGQVPAEFGTKQWSYEHGYLEGM